MFWKTFKTHTSGHIRKYEKKKSFIENEIVNLRMVFYDLLGADMRWFNPARISEIVKVFVADIDGTPPSNQSAELYFRDAFNSNNPNRLHTIPIISQHIDPCVYPLLFSRGEHSWWPSIPLTNQSTRRQIITMLEYVQHNFAIKGNFSLIYSSGKLAQQYVVDLRVEASHLDYIRNHHIEL